MIFACMPGFRDDEREVILLAQSIRQWAGFLSQDTIWVLDPEQVPLSIPTQKALRDIGVTIIPFRLPEQTLSFPYAQKVIAAAEAERMARSELLVWMDSDTLVLGQPDEFLLSPDKLVGCCPVHLKNVSSPADEPPNAFWKSVYTGCDTPLEKIFSVTSTVDRLDVRAHFNAGLLVVRPQVCLLQYWAKNFMRLFQTPEFQQFYVENRLYRIFIHQAVLSATLVAIINRTEIHLFSERYNVPSFLRTSFPGIPNDPITCRYDEVAFFQNPHWTQTEVDIQSKIIPLLEKLNL